MDLRAALHAMIEHIPWREEADKLAASEAVTREVPEGRSVTAPATGPEQQPSASGATAPPTSAGTPGSNAPAGTGSGSGA